MIEARGLHKDYGGKPVLAGIDLSLRQGEITGIIGPSGGGKTTLLRALLLLNPPDSGTLAVDGQEYRFPLVADAPPKPWPRVTAVFQQLFLWPHLTLRDNIMLPLRCRKQRDAAAIVAPLIETFGMAVFIDRYPNEVSGGQQQRAALVRALALQPAYLMLDEITSALDVEQAGILLTHLQELKATGIGILLITHHLGFLRRAADQVIFVDHGQVVEAGPPSMLAAPQSERLREFMRAAE
jgi:ABC-type polar amino acid transport system ATPase subunit